MPQPSFLRLLLVCGLVLLTIVPTRAAAPTELLAVRATTDSVTIAWNSAAASEAELATAISTWQQTPFGTVTLPTRLVQIHINGQAPAQVVFDQVDDVAWLAALPPAQAMPPAQSSEGAPRPELTQSAAMPTAPVVVLRDSTIRGERLIVLAVYPIFVAQGGVRLATAFEAHIAGAQLIAGAAYGATAGSERENRAATLPPAAQLAPTNAATRYAIATIRVSQSGIQRVTAAALAAAGVEPSKLAPAQLHLYVNGSETALEVRNGGGSLSGSDELRFYAAQPGDRWNSSTVYWLTVEPTAAQRMSQRSAMPSGAASRSSAIERGTWRNNRLYDSTLAGPQGDHWYAADLKTGPGQPAASLSVLLTPTLPLAVGSTTLQVSGSAYTSGQHSLQSTISGSNQTAFWSGVGSWTQSFTLAASASSTKLTLVPSSVPDGVEIAQVAWSRLVSLDFGGGGAAFEGVGGRWQYQLANTAADRALYDVTDPLKPVVLQLPAGTQPTFEDGPAALRYLLSGPGTLFEPTITAYQPVDITMQRNGAAVYIAPAALLPALAPLVAQRQAQGYSVRTIDVQQIYDAWSFGSVAPDAIRAFLRYASAAWDTPPIAVTLVGDGSADPLNYLGKNNPNLIPPYLAMVDPWIGETACETCYAQLDGANPLSDALPDLALGRLPVKNATELTAVVAKIIGYENAPTDPSWQSRSILIADNYRQADNTPDQAGDFAALADQVGALAPRGVAIQRMYYDPSPSNPGTSYREPDAARARDRTIEALQQGAGRVTYVGHSHQWQWAVTDTTLNTPYLFGLYDVDGLTNAGKLPIILELTCLTGAFQIPSFSGTSIDERFVLKADGGAIAVFSSTGLGVDHGHDLLARGFDRMLWAAPSQRATLGDMVMASYNEVFTNATCCQETLRTYGLMGDPLTRARALAAQQVYLPFSKR